MKDHSREPGFYETIRREMRLAGYGVKTIKSYLSWLRSFVRYFHPRHPRTLTEDDIRNYLLHLIETKRLEMSSVNQAFNALRLLYVDLYGMEFTIENVPRPQKGKKLFDVLSDEEVLRIFQAVRNLKHRIMLMMIYASGLR